MRAHEPHTLTEAATIFHQLNGRMDEFLQLVPARRAEGIER